MNECAIAECHREAVEEERKQEDSQTGTAESAKPPFDLCLQHIEEWASRFHFYGTSGRQEYVIALKPSFTDERGSILNILNCPIEHVAIITCAKGSTRANHYHPPGNTQFMFCVSGRYLASSQEVDRRLGTLIPGTLKTQLIRAGDLHEAPAMLGHRYDFLEPTVFLNLNTKLRHADGYGRHTLPITLPAPDLTPYA